MLTDGCYIVYPVLTLAFIRAPSIFFAGGYGFMGIAISDELPSSSGTGFDAVTIRIMKDRFLIFVLSFVNIFHR